jgi:hypothetical protein
MANMGEQTATRTAGMERIAFASSHGPQNMIRWTELALYHAPNGVVPAHPGRKFFATAIGKTKVRGEQEFYRERRGRSIEEVSRLFDNSRLHDEIVSQAQAWIDAHPEFLKLEPPTIQFNGAGGLRGALLWLYPAATSEASDRRLAVLFEADWGVPVRTVTHTLSQEEDGLALPSWCKAFLGALQHFDRDAFHAMRRA